jgi:pimeloyl-ACP methyl ester carboxylesterase
MSKPSLFCTRRGVLAAAATAVLPLQSNGAVGNIRPFRVHFSNEALADLHRRVAGTRWPTKELTEDTSQGVQLKTMRKLAQYWQNGHDWRNVEARLNAMPMFLTEIDGLDIHFIHVRSRHPGALPLIITHGWPGSVIELLKVVGPLTDPTAHGGSADDAFDVVIPSLPGHGFSAKPIATGWNPQRIARAWGVLMTRLGYTRYIAQGGDWGDAVTEQMAVQAPAGLLAIHTNMPAAVPDEIAKALAAGAGPPDGLSVDEKVAFDQLTFFYKHGLGYAQEMANRPQTLYALEDSPVGLAAWMLDHDARSYELIVRVFDGKAEGITCEDVLDNITLYWLTETAVSSARLYWENVLGFFEPKQVSIPVAVSVFPDEIYAAPRSWVERAFPNLLYFNQLPSGGHFAAWEQPVAFSAEMRTAFRSFRV